MIGISLSLLIMLVSMKVLARTESDRSVVHVLLECQDQRVGFGFPGDAQLQELEFATIFEQLLLRSWSTYSPKGTKAKFTLGYGYVAGGYGD